MIDHTKIHAFRQHEKHRENLRLFTESDTGKLLLQLLREGANTRVEPKPDPLIPFDTLLAHKFQYERGAADILDAIEDMTMPIQQAETVTPHEDILKAGQAEFDKAMRNLKAIKERQADTK